jgi:hypothetical protein
MNLVWREANSAIFTVESVEKIDGTSTELFWIDFESRVPDTKSTNYSP